MSAAASTNFPELKSALDHHGIRSRRVDLISPLGERKGARFAYRVETEDGRTVKLRYCSSEEEASRLRQLRKELGVAFAPVLAQYGPVLVEEWIDGAPLSLEQAEERTFEAGAILGQLHARCVAAEVSTKKWLDGALSDLNLLGSAGHLTAEEITRFGAELAPRDPQIARTTLIHKDFCAENMLIDTRGQLRIIDNEQLCIEPAGFDLGLTYQRWPMSDSAWQGFVRGYLSTATATATATATCRPQAIGFWKLVGALLSTRVVFQRIPVRLTDSLPRLRRLLDGTRHLDSGP